MAGNHEVHAKVRNLSTAAAAKLQAEFARVRAEVAPDAHGEIIDVPRNQLPKGWHGWKQLLGGGEEE